MAVLEHDLAKPSAHGTRSRYVGDGCRCGPCTAADRAYKRERRRAQHRPDIAWVARVDATAARRHLEALLADGETIEALAERTGVAERTLRRVRARATRRIRPDTAAAILAVESIAVPSPAQLLRDLIARGFYRRWIAEQLGVDADTVSRIVGGRPPRPATVEAIVALHRRCAALTPPAKRTRWGGVR